MEIKKITREELAKIINSPALKITHIIKMANEEYDVVVPEDATKEEAIDIIFEAYNAAIVEIETNKYQQRAEKQTRTRKSKSSDGKPSRKQTIINLIASGEHTKESLIETMDVEYGYAAKGKSSKTRVSKVIRELKGSNSLTEAADGTLGIKGK